MYQKKRVISYACAIDCSFVAITVLKTIKFPTNQHRVQLHEMHLNFENYRQVVSNFQDADCDTRLNVRQMPGNFH